MKKLFLTGCIGLLMASCSKKENTAVQSPEQPGQSEQTVSQLSGEQQIQTLDCSGCHAVDERMIGPSYREIAGKYTEKDAELLASKIIEGGSGVWGSVPMPPHQQISREDAKKMVGYILTLKNK